MIYIYIYIHTHIYIYTLRSVFPSGYTQPQVLLWCVFSLEAGGGLELKDILVWFQEDLMESDFALFFTSIFQAAKSSPVNNGWTLPLCSLLRLFAWWFELSVNYLTNPANFCSYTCIYVYIYTRKHRSYFHVCRFISPCSLVIMQMSIQCTYVYCNYIYTSIY